MLVLGEQVQVKSRQRVTDHGEVFTAPREVNAMLDLVKPETERIDSRFLEPACGDGNFLVEILRRKLVVVKRKYKRSHLDYEKNSILAITSIYGVDILKDNVEACRDRLFEIWNNEYTEICKKDANDESREAVKFILERNILCGDALTMRANDGGPIIFSEWAFITGSNLQRSEYRLDKLLDEKPVIKNLFGEVEEEHKPEFEQQDLFSCEENKTNSHADEGEFLQKYITNYRRVQDYGR